MAQAQLAPQADPAAPAATALPILAFAHFLNDGYVNYVPGILPALIAADHIPLALAGAVVLALQGVTSLAQPLVGLWADRQGGRGFIWIGLALAAAGASAVGLAHDLPVLLCVLLLTGIGNTVFHPQALAAATSAGGGRGMRLSGFLVGGEVGRGLWPVAISALVAWAGLGALPLICLPALVAVPALAVTAPVLPPRPSRSSDLRGRLGPAATLVGFSGLRAAAVFGLSTFAPLLWHARGGSLVGGASLLSAMLLVGVVGNLAGGWMADRFGHHLPLLLTSLAGAALVPLLALASGAWAFIVMGLSGIVLFAGFPLTMLAAHDLFPESRSMASGLVLGGGNAVGAFAVFALGPLAAAVGIPAALWALAAGLIAAAGLSRRLPSGAAAPAASG